MKTTYKYLFDPADEIIKLYLQNLKKKDRRQHFKKNGEPSEIAIKSAESYSLPTKMADNYHIEKAEFPDTYLIDSGKEGKTIFYIHGGAYWDQPTSFHYSFLRKLVNKIGGKAYIPVYPKAPTHHLPEVHAFLKEAYSWVREKDGGDNLIMMGDSAGGGCTLALAAELSAQSQKVPPLILLSPWLDLSCAKKDKKRDSDPWLNRKSLGRQGEIYAGETGVASPLASPLYADLSRVDDVMIITGTSDILSYDALLLEEKYPKIDLYVFEKAYHDFSLFPVGIASDKSFSLIVSRLDGSK